MSGKAPVPFVVRWRWAICGSELSSVARHVGLVGSLYASTDGTGIYPGGSRLASDTGLTVRCVRTATKDLVDGGWWVAERAGGSPAGGQRQAAQYRLAIPTGEGDSPVNDDHRCISRPRPVNETTSTGEPRSPQEKGSRKEVPVADPSPAPGGAADSRQRWDELTPEEQDEWVGDVCFECDVVLEEVITPRVKAEWRRAAGRLLEACPDLSEIGQRVAAYRCRWKDYRSPTPVDLVRAWAEISPLPDDDDRLLQMRRHDRVALGDQMAETAPLDTFLPGRQYGPLVIPSAMPPLASTNGNGSHS